MTIDNPFPLNPYPPDYIRPEFDPEIYEEWENQDT